MCKGWFGALLACGVILFAASESEGTNTVRVVLQEHRGSELDLAVAGELPGVPPGATRYISREELLKLPQVTYGVSDDANFKGKVQISGVLLEELTRALDVSSTADL